MHQNRYIFAAVALLSAFLYAALLYATPRSDFFQLTGIYALLFTGYIWVAQGASPGLSGKMLRIRQLLIPALLFRLLAMLALPQLSDDYFRFVWDGRLLAQGENPFLLTPEQWMAQPEAAARLGLEPSLFQGLNSPRYFTIYPPVLQFLFWLGAVLFPGNIYGHVLLMKVCVFAAECGSLWLILRLLQKLNLPPQRIALYAWNPLVVIELCGNLHFEALMVFFLLLAAWLLLRAGEQRGTQAGRLYEGASALAFALAICSKLLPLMALPMLIRRIGLWPAVRYGLIAGLATLLMFLPLFDRETFLHLFSSVQLYFQKFEFNGSLYAIVRWWGYQERGYNIIEKAGKYLAAITAGGILLLALAERRPTVANWLPRMLWVWMVYLAMASIVHPWYV
ncbi:MAG: hypothetical protein EAZ89_09665, partial [Bacteroidetes bacterium]